MSPVGGEGTGDAAGPTADAARATAAPVGDVQVRVEWTQVPAAVRRSPGTTACGTPRAPSVSPSTTWGIGDVLVVVEGAPASAREARVRWRDCALHPRLVVGDSLVIDSGADRPARLALAPRARVDDLRAELAAPTPRAIMLPIAGHQVEIPLDAGAVYRLDPDAKTSEPAWIVAGRGAVTDPTGVVLVRDVPAGVHAVRAWLPPRGGQPARHGRGEVTVVGGELAELTLQLGALRSAAATTADDHHERPAGAGIVLATRRGARRPPLDGGLALDLDALVIAGRRDDQHVAAVGALELAVAVGAVAAEQAQRHAGRRRCSRSPRACPSASAAR